MLAAMIHAGMNVIKMLKTNKIIHVVLVKESKYPATGLKVLITTNVYIT